jgi:hypothetical protein
MDGTCYDESRYERQEAKQEEREKQRALAALARLGYNVTLSPVAEVAKVPAASFHPRRSPYPFKNQDIG